MVKYTHVEVRKAPVGWMAVAYGKNDEDRHENKILKKTRWKIDAMLVAEGAARVLEVELRVSNRKGRYTNEARSYGNDPRDIPG